MAGARERIKEQMELYKMSYGELSNATGIPRSTIHHYVTSECKLPIDFVEAVAKPLHTTPEYLMGWEEEYKNKVRNELYAKRKVLFDMTEKATPKDLDMVIGILERLLDEENG